MVLAITPPLQRPPWLRQSPALLGPFLSHFHPQGTQVSETLSSLALQGLSLSPAGRGAQPQRAAPGVNQLCACPGTWGSSSPTTSGHAAEAASG